MYVSNTWPSFEILFLFWILNHHRIHKNKWHTINLTSNTLELQYTSPTIHLICNVVDLQYTLITIHLTKIHFTWPFSRKLRGGVRCLKSLVNEYTYLKKKIFSIRIIMGEPGEYTAKTCLVYCLWKVIILYAVSQLQIKSRQQLTNTCLTNLMCVGLS